MQFLRNAVIAGIALSTCNLAAAAPETFAIDPDHTHPMFEATHLGISIQRGRFDKAAGKITLDRDAKTGRIDITIDAASISMGFEAWNKMMRGEDFFNVAKFPVITFKASKLIFEGDRLVAAD